MTLRLAVLISHPIQYMSPWHREVARLKEVDLRVYYYCDWGVAKYVDPGFQSNVEWDVPLLEGFAHEFLPIRRKPERLHFTDVDNPTVGEALDDFGPDVVQIFGYAYRTNWRVARWAHKRRRPLLLVSDSNAKTQTAWWRRVAKQGIVRYFYSHVDGAFFVGDSNLAYHMRYGLPRDRLFQGMIPIDRQRLLLSGEDRIATRLAVRKRFGIPPEAFVVLLCGKYIPRKRPLDVVAAAWRAVQNGMPIWSLLVGEGPDRKAIEEYCRKERITNTVLTGFVNQSNIPEYYMASDVNILPSSREPYGLAISEGNSFGLPVIVSDQVGCIGVNDPAQPGVNAIVYPCGNGAHLQKAIESLYKDRDLYKRMSTASVGISESLDATLAAKALVAAACELHRLGPR